VGRILRFSFNRRTPFPNRWMLGEKTLPLNQGEGLLHGWQSSTKKKKGEPEKCSSDGERGLIRRCFFSSERFSRIKALGKTGEMPGGKRSVKGGFLGEGE